MPAVGRSREAALTGERSAVLTLALAATMISFSAVFVKIVHMGPIVSGFYRVFFGGLILIGAAGYGYHDGAPSFCASGFIVDAL